MIEIQLTIIDMRFSYEVLMVAGTIAILWLTTIFFLFRRGKPIIDIVD